MKRRSIEIDSERCTGCGLCVSDCAEGAIRISNGKAIVISDSYCDGLGACLGACPENALSIIEREAAPFDEAAAAQECGHSPDGEAHESPFSAAPPRSASGAPWPVKARLVHPRSEFLHRAHIIIAADCAPVAAHNFHARFCNAASLLIMCPKFEPAMESADKLAAIFKYNNPASCTVIRMKAPCCKGLVATCKTAWAHAGAQFPMHEMVLGSDGQPLVG